MVVGLAPGGIVTLTGRVSTTLTFAAGEVVGLKKVIRRRERSLGSMILGVKLLLTPRFALVVKLVVACPGLLRP